MTSEGNNYYRYTFSSVSKINLQFIESDGTQGKELTRNTNSGTNEFWYKGNRGTTNNHQIQNMKEQTLEKTLSTS